MKTINDLIGLSKQYDTAFDRRNERLKIWAETKLADVHESLQKIKDELIENVAFYKVNLYVGGNESAPLDGVSLFCGNQRVSNDGSPERGFKILFFPVDNGKIASIVYEHALSDESSRGHEIGLYEPEELEHNKIIDIVYDGIAQVQNSSRLFIGD